MGFIYKVRKEKMSVWGQLLRAHLRNLKLWILDVKQRSKMAPPIYYQMTQ